MTERNINKKDYLSITTGSEFANDLHKYSRPDTCIFHTAYGSAAEDDRDTLTDIMAHAAMCFFRAGADIDGMQVSLSNDPDGGNPLWRRDEAIPGAYRITLCADCADDWSQIIYQLGYLFAHCLIDRCGLSGAIPWLEETVCEVMQPWLLLSFIGSWTECPLYGSDPGYVEHLTEYLHDFLFDQPWTNKPARCKTRKKLLKLNENAANRPGERAGAVCCVFGLMRDNDVRALLYHGAFAAKETGLIDTDAWTAACPDSLAVRYLASLQDNAREK